MQDPGPGISETLAHDRAGQLSHVRYDLSLFIPADRRTPISARETIRFTLAHVSGPVVLDFNPGGSGALRKTLVNGALIAPLCPNGHIVLPVSALQPGENVAGFEFEAGDAPLNRNDDFLYTIFVPARAHEAFPCFDQPDVKARWTLSLDVPAGWETLANGAEVSRSSLGGRVLVTFEETPPISTYLFAFASGRFKIEHAVCRGRGFRLLHRETDTRRMAHNLGAIVGLHASALEWLEAYTDIPYPFGKLDALLLPAFQFGGMEHPGAIFYAAPLVILDEGATQTEKLDRANLIAHETTHMWFGDLVTMGWFSDVWMKEVFANLLAAKIVRESFPDVDHDLRFLLAHVPPAYEIDRTVGTNAIREPLDNLSNAGTLYGAIVYHKAPLVLQQLEGLLGQEAFRSGVREYLRRHAFGSATWTDLLDLLNERTDVDLGIWSRAWIEEPGRPSIAAISRCDRDRVTSLTLSQRDLRPSRDLIWRQQLRVALVYPDRVALLPMTLDRAEVDVPSAAGLPAPAAVLPDGDGSGYGHFRLDQQSLQWLLRHLPAIDRALTRGVAWITLWEAMLNREIEPTLIIDLALQALTKEDHELNVQWILSRLSRTYWRFTSPAGRLTVAPRVEETLRERLHASPQTSLKAAYFSTLRGIALTAPMLDWLEAVWLKDEVIPDLTLSEGDDIELAKALTIRRVSGRLDILDRQIDRTVDGDRRARLRFIRSALSGERRERDTFFASLAEPGNRQHEPWVIEGLRCLHHPMRAGDSVGYIDRGLGLLEEIQRTGDIFFPKRWLEGTLDGHQSREAARAVRGFLDGRTRGPEYPERLRRMILSTADELFRASEILEGA